MKKLYIENFCDDLNYREVVLFVDDSVNFDELLARLNEDCVSHLYRFECVRENRLFYIENCDLQNVTIVPDWNELFSLVQNDYTILHLKQDDTGFYIVIPDMIALQDK